MSQKPKFVFFKMLGCGHCVNFYNQPSVETSTWAKLVKDPELSSKIEPVMIEWGGVYEDGKLVKIHPVPEVYKTIGPEGQGVTYGPFFYLHQAGEGKEGNGIEMKNVAREFSSMKKWILSNVDSFVSSKPPTRRTAAPAPIKKEPRPRLLSEMGPSTPGKPEVFNQQKLGDLPLDVRSRLQRQNSQGSPARDLVESEPKYVPVQPNSQKKTSTPNLQPYVQALTNSSTTGYQNSNDATKFRQNQVAAGSHATMNKAEHMVSSQRKYIPRNRKK